MTHPPVDGDIEGDGDDVDVETESDVADEMQQTRKLGKGSPIYVTLPTRDADWINDVPMEESDRCRRLLHFLRLFYKQILLMTAFGFTGILFLIFSRQYVQRAIHLLEDVDVGWQCCMFLLFFVICSFPLMWGYIVLVISAGFLHGVIFGGGIVIVCAGAGVTVSHLVLSSCLRNVVKRKILPSRQSLQALISAVDGENGLRVVTLARLTPIPFGIQNAVFSVSSLPRWRYVLASMLGLLPGQLIEVYIGNSLKSLGELWSHSHASPMNVTIVAFQIGMTLSLFYYLFYLAKKELRKITELNAEESLEAARDGGRDGGREQDLATLLPVEDEMEAARGESDDSGRSVLLKAARDVDRLV